MTLSSDTEGRATRYEVTFIGGPWDMHRVWTDKTPDKWMVPVMERRLSARTSLVAEGAGEPIANLFKAATYRLARWVAFGSTPKFLIYVYEDTR